MSAAWEKRAACRGADVSLFFAADDEDASGHRYTQARHVCNSCPVAAPCLEAAMGAEGSADRQSRAGMWGGLSPAERAWLRATHTAATADIEAGLSALADAVHEAPQAQPGDVAWLYEMHPEATRWED